MTKLPIALAKPDADSMWSAVQEHIEEEVAAVLGGIVGDIELELEPEVAAARAAAQDQEVSPGHLSRPPRPGGGCTAQKAPTDIMNWNSDGG